MVIKKLILSLLLGLAVVSLIVISAWTNLNSNTLTPWLESRLNGTLPRKYLAEVGVVETRISGLEIDQVKIRDLKANKIVLDIRSAFVSLGIFQLLFFQEVDYSAELYGGIVEGEIDLFPRKSIDFTISGLQINQNAVIRTSNLITSNPVVQGEGTVFIDKNPEGNLNLMIKDISLTGNPRYTNIPFELPDAVFSRLNGEIALNGNQLDVRLISKGDLSANLEGLVKLNRARPLRSDFNLNLAGSLTPEFESKLGFFKSILVNYKNAAGKVSINLSGNLQRPRVKKN